MHRTLIKRGFVVVLGVGLVALAAGCAASRSVNRGKILEAENIDLRQRADLLENQVRDAHIGQDHAVTELQQAQHEKAEAERQADLAAAQVDQALVQLGEIETELERRQRENAEMQRKLALLDRPAPRVTPAPAPRPDDATRYSPSPAVTAFQQDLQQRLAAANVRGLPVQIRTAQDGTRRVAVVLEDAFPSGKATLAYNASAVKAVIGLGRLMQEHYPSSRISIEGHTDSDPIRVSPWGTNEKLSQARAEAVKTLLTNTGLPQSRIETAGLGASQPLARGNTRRAKSQNRRVEVFITP